MCLCLIVLQRDAKQQSTELVRNQSRTPKGTRREATASPPTQASKNPLQAPHQCKCTQSTQNTIRHAHNQGKPASIPSRQAHKQPNSKRGKGRTSKGGPMPHGPRKAQKGSNAQKNKGRVPKAQTEARNSPETRNKERATRL